MPISVLGTEATHFFWLAFTLRDQLWHGVDVTGKAAAIRHARPGRATYPEGVAAAAWSSATGAVYTTGPAALLSIRTPVHQQIEWLQRQDPDHLMTYPTNLMALLGYCREQGITFPRLRMVETLAEILYAEVRAACREVWGVKVVDMYSAQEVGYIALQCPDHEHYHVQSESALVEVLDEKERACRPGETGRMVVTPLHNFAMPLIRYDVGDYGVVGEPCPCGRGLPVLTSVLGRVRNMLTLPSGERFWPVFHSDRFLDMAPVRQYQVVQKNLDEIEVRLVVDRPLTEAGEEAIRKVVHGEVGDSFRVAFVYVDEIPRSKGGKYEDFRSEVAG
jgi:phenylacetate-CoA ligase